MPVWPSCLVPGSCRVLSLGRANIETLPTGGGEHKTRRRRRVTSQSQVSDAGGRVAEHDDG